MNRFKRLGIYFPLLILFTLASVILRSVALFKNSIFGSGYFSDERLITIANILVLCGCVILFTFIFISPKIKVVARFDSPNTYIPSGIVATAMVFLSSELAIMLAKKPGKLLSAETLFSKNNCLLILTGLCALVCVGYFIFSALFTRKEDEARALFGILVTVFLALYASYLYFDKKLPINSPNKLVDQTAFLMTAIFFLFETRISLGREKWRGYCAFGMIASLITAYSSIPTLIHYFAGGELASDSLSGAVLALSLFIYITARVLSVNTLKEQTVSDTTLAIKMLMNKRQSELELPEASRTHEDDSSFTTLGKNYEFDIRLSEHEGERVEEESEEQSE